MSRHERGDLTNPVTAQDYAYGTIGNRESYTEAAGTPTTYTKNALNQYTTTNMPMLLAGGGFRHGQHLAFDRGNNYPLPNLFVSMLQRLGVETHRFATSTGTMRGLDPAG